MTHTLAITGLAAPDSLLLGDAAPDDYQHVLAELSARHGLGPDGLHLPGSAPIPAAPVPAAPANALWVLEALAQRYPGLTFALFYQAPWLAFDAIAARDPRRFAAEPGAVLALWRAYHQEALRLARTLGKRLLLINAGHSDCADPALHTLLRRDYGIALPSPGAPADSSGAADPARHHGFGVLLATLASDCCDIHDMLESCATLLGREPEFRPMQDLPGGDSLTPVLERWVQPQLLALKQAELEAAGQQLQLQQQQRAQLLQELGHANACAAAAQEQWRQEQAARHAAEAQQRDDQAAARLADAALQSQLGQARSGEAAARQELAALQARFEQERAAVAAQQQQAAAACQLELEQALAAAQRERDAAAALHGQLQQAREQAQAAQQQAESRTEQLRHSSDESAQQRQAAAALLLLLHQTQEQLETAYLEGDALQALLGEAQAAFTRGRHLLAQLSQAALTPD